MIRIECDDNGDEYGIVASTDDGIVTDDSWLCSSERVRGWDELWFADEHKDFVSQWLKNFTPAHDGTLWTRR